jgi:hypothetical protein
VATTCASERAVSPSSSISTLGDRMGRRRVAVRQASGKARGELVPTPAPVPVVIGGVLVIHGADRGLIAAVRASANTAPAPRRCSACPEASLSLSSSLSPCSFHLLVVTVSG